MTFFHFKHIFSNNFQIKGLLELNHLYLIQLIAISGREFCVNFPPPSQSTNSNGVWDHQSTLCSALPGRLSQLDARVLCVKIQLRATQEQTKACEFSLIGPWEGGWVWFPFPVKRLFLLWKGLKPSR